MGVSVGGGVQGGCEQRIEIFVKIKKKMRGGGGEGSVEGVRVDVTKRIKISVKIQKKNQGGGDYSRGWRGLDGCV